MVNLFTSGSRGAPKGVIHTHGSALRATAAGLEARCIRRRSAIVHPDAVLLDWRLQWRTALGAHRASDHIDGVHAGGEPDDPIPGKGASDPLPRLAGPDFATVDLTSLRPLNGATVTDTVTVDRSKRAAHARK